MQNDWVTITLPMNAQALGTLLLVSGVFMLSWLTYLMLRRDYEEDLPTRLLNKLGLSNLHPVAFVFLATLWLLLFLSFAAGAFWVLYGIAHRIHVTDASEAVDLRWYLLTLTAVMAALGAVITLPFTLIRLALTRRQTQTAEQGHITDRINKAVEGLGAEKQATFQRKDSHGNPTYGKNDDDTNDYSNPVMVTETKLNLEVRVGAIYALERIAQDSERDHIQIMEILCAYIRQNANQVHVLMPKNEHPTPRDWLLWGEKNRQYPRLDIDVALRVIERREPARKGLEIERNFRLGLERAELRKFKLGGRDLTRSDLSGALLQGTDLSHAVLQGANLYMAKMQGASLSSADLSGADLYLTRLNGANLTDANLRAANLRGTVLQQATLWRADLRNANLTSTNLQGATLSGANCENAFFFNANFDKHTALSGAKLRYAAVRNIDFSNIPQIINHLGGMFGDGSVTLPVSHGQKHARWLAHWPREKLSDDEFRMRWQNWQAARKKQ